MSHKTPPCCEVRKRGHYEKTWYLIHCYRAVGSKLGWRMVYHEYSKPKTAQELKTLRVCVFTDYSCAARICYEGIGDSGWSVM